MAQIKIGINGFGRIGRMVFRAACAQTDKFQVVGINDLCPVDYLAYMLKFAIQMLMVAVITQEVLMMKRPSQHSMRNAKKTVAKKVNINKTYISRSAGLGFRWLAKK